MNPQDVPAKVFKLTIKERLYLLQLLPATGDYAQVCTVKGMADRVNISDEERQKYGVRAAQGGLSTDPKFDKETFDFTFSDNELAIIERELIALDKQKQLSVGNSNLYTMFVVNKDKNLVEATEKIVAEGEKALEATLPPQ